MSMRTVTYSESVTNSISLFECTDIEEELKICSAHSYYKVFIPSVTISYFPTFIQVVLLQEFSRSKKKITSEFIIGVVCIPICSVFVVIGIIILLKTRQPKINSSDICDDSSDISNDQNMAVTNEKIINIDYGIDKNDDWL